MALSVLISESDEKWANELRSFLQEKSYFAEIALNGKDCQMKVYKNKYLAIVLDIDTKNHSGLEVLRYMRLNAPSVKVLLTFPSKKKFEELDLDSKSLAKLGVSEILVRPYTLEELVKRIEGANQFEAWKNIKVTGQAKEEELITEDDNLFTRVKIENFYSGNATIFNCYIRISENKYVRILHKGDFFDDSRIKKYAQEKSIEYLYFKTEERAQYINFINLLLSKSLDKKSIPIAQKVNAAQNLSEKYMEEVYMGGLKPQLIEEGKTICDNIFHLTNKDPGISKLLHEYIEYDDSAFGHLFLTSFFACVICNNLEWTTQRTVELIAMGALLHDIGMLKLSEEIRNRDPRELSEDQFKKYKNHPLYGAQMLQQYNLITEPVRQIVYQHHEYINGEGFPNGLTGLKIYPPAKIVSLADNFSEALQRSKTAPVKVLREFITDRANVMKYDPEIVKALLRSFIREK